jgi:hypothetical protein
MRRAERKALQDSLHDISDSEESDHEMAFNQGDDDGDSSCCLGVPTCIAD